MGLRSLTVFIIKPKLYGKVVCISQLSPHLLFTFTSSIVAAYINLKSLFSLVFGIIYFEDRLIGEPFMLRMCAAFDGMLKQSTGMK